MPLNIFEITRTTFLIKFGFLYSLVPVAAAVFSGTFAEGFVNNKLFAAFPKLNILLMPPLISDGAVLKTKGVNFSVQVDKNTLKAFGLSAGLVSEARKMLKSFTLTLLSQLKSNAMLHGLIFLIGN